MGSSVRSIGLAGAFAWFAQSGLVVPYVVEIEASSTVRRINPASHARADDSLE